MIIRENKVSFLSIIQRDELKTGQTMHFLAVGRYKSITENGELEQLANWSIKGPENSTLRLLGFVRYIVRLVRPIFTARGERKKENMGRFAAVSKRKRKRKM